MDNFISNNYVTNMLNSARTNMDKGYFALALSLRNHLKRLWNNFNHGIIDTQDDGDTLYTALCSLTRDLTIHGVDVDAEKKLDEEYSKSNSYLADKNKAQKEAISLLTTENSELMESNNTLSEDVEFYRECFENAVGRADSLITKIGILEESKKETELALTNQAHELKIVKDHNSTHYNVIVAQLCNARDQVKNQKANYDSLVTQNTQLRSMLSQIEDVLNSD